MNILAYLIGFCLMSHAFAETDNLGKTYPIQEPDLLDDIQKKLKAMERSGELARLQKEAVTRSRDSIERPTPVAGLKTTSKARTFYFDPSMTVPRDIKTPDGKLIAKAGDKVNPLNFVSMSKHLVLFDQRDKRQVVLAEQLVAKYQGKIKPILVAGEPFTLMKQWKKQVYFDQGGYIVNRLGITQVPALVSQDMMSKRLRIDELEVKK